MTSHRATFLSGALFGAALGLAAGHLTIFRPGAQSESTPPTWAAVGKSGTDYDFSLGEKSASLPSLSEPFFSEETIEEPIISPLQNAIAVDVIEDDEPTDDVRTSAESTSQAPTEPQPLPVANAAPLTESGPQTDQIRELIDLELSDLPHHQREIWHESLKDVRKEDVAGILRMWKLFGRGGPGLSLPLSDTPPKSSPPAPEVEHPVRAPSQDQLRHIIGQAKAIRLQNIAMAYSRGYVRQVPSLVECRTAKGLQICGLHSGLDFNALQTHVTGFSLDLAIAGPGLFVVVDGQGERFYTRNGRFSIDSQRRLVLAGLAGNDDLVLHPEIRLPEGMKQLRVSLSGEVTAETAEGKEKAGQIELAVPHGPDDLEYYANGLLRPKEPIRDEVRLLSPGTEEVGTIQQGRLDSPVIDPAEEWKAIEALDHLLTH